MPTGYIIPKYFLSEDSFFVHQVFIIFATSSALRYLSGASAQNASLTKGGDNSHL